MHGRETVLESVVTMHDTDDTLQARDADRQARSKQSRQQEANDLKWLMSTEQGRRVAGRVLALTGIHQSSFTGNSETFFKEGRRSVGLALEAEITTHCFSEYLLMLKEHKERNSK